MRALAAVAPEFASEIAHALDLEGRELLAQQVNLAVISHCTYEQDDDAGYIYFTRGPISAHFAKLAAPVAETISFYDARGINIDIDNDGHLYGIEFLNRSDVVAKLRTANEL